LTFLAERFNAVDSEEITVTEEVRELFPETFKKRSKAEICCAISHYRLWRKLIQDKDSRNYLIMEDDTCFKVKEFNKIWNEVFSKKMPLDYSLIFLGGCQPWNEPHYKEVLRPYNSFYNRVKENDYFSKGDNFWHMNANSYIISKQAASLLCQWVEQNGMDCGVDHFMIKFFNGNKIFKAPQSIYHLNPLVTYQIHEEGGCTEIDSNSDIRSSRVTF
jgi:GR25 family glycosyltransferase involved in LPS biosynthesis